MDADVAAALSIDRDAGARERTVDITTTGRRSGNPRRIETWFHRVEGTVYLVVHRGGATGQRTSKPNRPSRST
jgi:F420H(2)-dependent quinone reductase